MTVRDRQLSELADAILDGKPIDWAAAESDADDSVRPLLDPLRLVANVAEVHRRASLSDDEGESGEEPIADLRGQTVGVYRLIEPLGRGGMGEVYLGGRADGRFEQKVAVKLVKRGMDSVELLRRFARERKILARLEHPGIARLLDGGETPDGRPYFVMERVEGEKITEYCRAHAVPLEERLRLFASCCDIVDAAHRALVVHRDLKPSNILVTQDGQVKLLDFGIAKLLADEEGDVQLTRYGGRAITPAYAAPEQVLGGAVTMGTDVFALGVVLYELLTGKLPYDRRATTPQELANHVEHESAERPSIAARRAIDADGTDSSPRWWARRLRGDLDTITMTALAHDHERRYPSAAALADDVRRYLTSRPVKARPDSRTYRLRKFVTRHRLGVAASSIVTAAVLVALGVSLAETAAARRQAARAAAAEAFLTSLFDQVDPDRYIGSAPTVRDLVERGSERADRELGQQPELRADMQVILGRVFDQLFLPKQGETQWRRAVQTRESLFGAGDARTVRARKGLAISLARQARYAEAEPLFQQLLQQEQALGDRREFASILLNYANQKRLTGDYSTSSTLLERAVPILEAGGEPASLDLGAALNNLGLVYWRIDRGREAIKALERTLEIHLKKQGPDSSLVARTKMNLSLVHADLDELDIAERYAREALAVQQKLFSFNDPITASTLFSLGQIARRRGNRAEARAYYERSIASYEGAQHRDDGGLAHPLRHMAALLREEGQTQEALRLSERALALKRKAWGERHPEVAEFWIDLGRGRLASGDVSGAVEPIRTGVDIFKATLPADNSRLAAGLFVLGDVLRRNARPSEALPYLEQAQAIWRKKPPRDPKDLADLENAIADTRAALR